MKLCLDTSAINQLEDDPLRDILVLGIRSMGMVEATAVNLLEIADNTSASRRRALIGCLHGLAEGRTPLTLPDRLLGNFARTFHTGSDRVTIRVSDDVPNLSELLVPPDEFDPAVLEGWRSWRRNLEAQFRDAHYRARPAFVRFRLEGGALPDSAPRTLRQHSSDPAFVLEVANWLYEKSTGSSLTKGTLAPFLSFAPCFPLFLLGWSYGSYRMALQERDFGQRKNAGAFDLFSAAYLPFCDRFVTHDGAQYRALRLIARFAPNHPRVQRWVHFRSRLAPDLPAAV